MGWTVEACLESIGSGIPGLCLAGQNSRGGQGTSPALTCRSLEYLERVLFAQLEAVPKERQQCLAAGSRKGQHRELSGHDLDLKIIFKQIILSDVMNN